MGYQILVFFFLVIICIGGKSRAASLAWPENADSVNTCHDTSRCLFSRRFIHRIEVEGRPGYIFQTNSFLRGENYFSEPIRNSLAAHVKYAFQYRPGTCGDRIYGGAYQGIGLACYAFSDPDELGKPVALYLFQGARITRFASFLSFNYEWNFGLSWGWKPYDPEANDYNRAMGSRLNAYINTNFYLDWTLSPRIGLVTGIAFTHFSNGNTSFPNAGLNTGGVKAGLVYYVNREKRRLSERDAPVWIPEFRRHVSYDLVLFGSWRRKGVYVGDEQVASPEAYGVVGFSFAPMYNVGYKFRLGMALDGVYDGSANVYMNDSFYTPGNRFHKPPFRYQLALGLSGRMEYVMPFFTVGIGIGKNFLYGKGDLDACYQLLALKVKTSRNSFLHIGYSLQDFKTPSFLMLGFGFRFNNRYPVLN